MQLHRDTVGLLMGLSVQLALVCAAIKGTAWNRSMSPERRTRRRRTLRSDADGVDGAGAPSLASGSEARDASASPQSFAMGLPLDDERRELVDVVISHPQSPDPAGAEKASRDVGCGDTDDEFIATIGGDEAIDDGSPLRHSRLLSRNLLSDAVSPHSPILHAPSSAADVHLMNLIRRIQHEPKSHIFWKELRAYLLAQREEERRHGLVLQSQLPLVHFSEASDLIATQIEVRSLIAREPIRVRRSTPRSSPPLQHAARSDDVDAENQPRIALSSSCEPSQQRSATISAVRGGSSPSAATSAPPSAVLLPPPTVTAEGEGEEMATAVGESTTTLRSGSSSDDDDDVERMYHAFCARLQGSEQRSVSAARYRRVGLEDLRVGSDDDDDDDDDDTGSSRCSDDDAAPMNECCDGEIKIAKIDGSALETLPHANSTVDLDPAGTIEGSSVMEAFDRTNQSTATGSSDGLHARGVPIDLASAITTSVASSTHAIDKLSVGCGTPRPASATPITGSVATFFFKKLQDLKRHNTCLSVLIDPVHQGFSKELQRFEEQLMKIAERENPQLFPSLVGTAVLPSAPSSQAAVSIARPVSPLTRVHGPHFADLHSSSTSAAAKHGRPVIHKPSTFHSGLPTHQQRSSDPAVVAASPPPLRAFVAGGSSSHTSHHTTSHAAAVANGGGGGSNAQSRRASVTSASTLQHTTTVPQASLHASHVAAALKKHQMASTALKVPQMPNSNSPDGYASKAAIRARLHGTPSKTPDASFRSKSDMSSSGNGGSVAIFARTNTDIDRVLTSAAVGVSPTSSKKMPLSMGR